MSLALNLALVQTDLHWESPQKNRDQITAQLKELPSTVDLIVLPEMFSTGFSMRPSELYESMHGSTVKWMLSLALQKDAAVIGSLIIKDQGHFYNRLLFVEPSGKISTYDKRHRFTLAGEDQVYSQGSSKQIIEYNGWRICPLICYDLRFPVWARNTENYDVLIYVANWPIPRINAWTGLLQARAIENMSYCIGVNRVGTDPNGYEYSGNSIAIDYLGNPLTEVCEQQSKVILTKLLKEPMLLTREKLGFLKDMDAFKLE